MEKYAIVEKFRCDCGAEIEYHGHLEDDELTEELKKTAEQTLDIETNKCQHKFKRVD
jgi:hypothetical protein